MKSIYATTVLFLGCFSAVEFSFADSNTANLINAMTVCGAGLNLHIDANLQGSLSSLYDKDKTQGKADADIVPKIANAVITDQSARKDYSDCLLKVLATLK